MTVLSGHTIRELGIFEPFAERSRHEPTNTSYGLSMCGYDVRLDQDVWLLPGRTILASTLEKFTMPLDVVGIVHDKSTWARRGLSVQNTVIEPGWVGYLTLELLWSPLFDQESVYRLMSGTPIAQILFHRIDRPTQGYGDGKYQHQERGPQAAR